MTARRLLSSQLCHTRVAAARRSWPCLQRFVCYLVALVVDGLPCTLDTPLPFVQLSRISGQSGLRGRAVRCCRQHAESRPTARRCHMTTTAPSTGNLPTWLCTQSVSVAETNTQNRWSAAHIATSTQLGMIAPTARYPLSSHKATQEPSSRHTAGSGVLPSETAGVHHSTSCRLAWHGPCHHLEPHSIARAFLEPYALPSVRSLISQR